jgi:hypothetical protein
MDGAIVPPQGDAQVTLRPFYVFYGKLNEFPWTIVVLTPTKIRGHIKKHYMIGGAQQTPAGNYVFKTGFLPYRVDRKNRFKLGDKMKFEDLPPPIRDFIRTFCAVRQR